MPGTRTLAVVLLVAALGACSPLPQRESSDPKRRELPPPPYSIVLTDYKQRVAHRIVQVNRDTYSQPVPAVLKSIVVLQITVDEAGRPSAVVLRSNGYAHLEERAVASVAKAAPFVPPTPALLQGAPSVSFLETFLFRDDDFFQVRSLVPEHREASTREKLF